MNEDEVKGKAKEVTGRLKRQAGEWTGDAETQAEGATDEVTGKAQQGWGKAKESAENAADKLKKDINTGKENAA